MKGTLRGRLCRRRHLSKLFRFYIKKETFKAHRPPLSTDMIA
ncbi:hypothetical protein BDFB_002162 [Asbolus verrucosus]|uniref:Uncharacterized protein n=1 Tax=Asbolus verrucosus TaxID=1661398 RepID=A0A482VDD3_ASBVE|nr:hypothetical protein BDFB_002162 [Asbolus verrucosus]